MYLKKYPDHKIRLFDPVIDKALEEHVPDKVERELELDKEYDLIISSGNHKDSGMDNYMRNPDTYVYRKPYTLEINPDDAKERAIEDGKLVRTAARGGEITAPAEYSYRCSRGYVMIPHHFGLHIMRCSFDLHIESVRIL